MTVYNAGLLVKEVDFSNADWNTRAVHEVFTVTGCVKVKLTVYCSDTLTDAANAAIIQFGYEGATDGIIGATDAAGRSGTTITAGYLWYDTSPSTQIDTPANAQFERVIGGLDIGYEITGAALTGGKLVFCCEWEPISADGFVTYGDGTAL